MIIWFWLARRGLSRVRFMSAVGSGLLVGKWMVPLEVEKGFRWFLNLSIIAAVGKRLQWFEKAAYQTRMRFCLKAGIP